MSFIGAFSIKEGDIISFIYNNKKIDKFEVIGFSFNSETLGSEPQILIRGYEWTRQEDKFIKYGSSYVVKNLICLELKQKSTMKTFFKFRLPKIKNIRR